MKTTTPRVTLIEQSWTQSLSLAVWPSQGCSLLTFFPCAEELLDGVVEADSKRGKAYLSLETSRQPTIEFHWPFCFGQSGYCSQDAFIPDGSGGLAFTLDLEMRKIQVRGKWKLSKEVLTGEEKTKTGNKLSSVEKSSAKIPPPLRTPFSCSQFLFPSQQHLFDISLYLSRYIWREISYNAHFAYSHPPCINPPESLSSWWEDAPTKLRKAKNLTL